MTQSVNDFKLTNQQQEAYDKILEWLLNTDDKKFFSLVGNAGTGKSTLISHIFNDLESSRLEQIGLITKCSVDLNIADSLKKVSRKPAIISFTNKAVKVLKSKGLTNSKTIHGLLYNHIYDENKKCWTFERRSKSEIIKEHDLLIVDEASMVAPSIHKDLLTLDLPILYVGDNFQLPPILSSEEEKKYSKLYSVLENPHYILTDIQRQALNSPILHAANKVRRGEKLNYFNDSRLVNYKYFKSIYNNDYREKLVSDADAILCGINNSVKKANDYRRELYGYNITKYPYKGEKLIVLANNYELNLYNADMIICEDNHDNLNLRDDIDWKNIPKIQIHSEDKLDKSISIKPVFKQYLSEKEFNNYLIWLSCYNTIKRYKNIRKFPKFSSIQKEFMTKYNIVYDEYNWYEIVEVSFGYALTTHKSQGSEFSNVIVLNESRVFKEFADRHLYTSITRAKDVLTILDYLFPYNYKK